MTTTWDIVRGECSDGVSRYVPAVNCLRCGRYVGRDGSIEIETFEMSNEVASVSGTCARCVPIEAAEDEAGDAPQPGLRWAEEEIRAVRARAKYRFERFRELVEISEEEQ